MDKLVSIIVPVYNVSAYLDECICSLVAQSYRNLEILLVDDGSTDPSGAICDRWAEKDARVRAIHKKNGGAASARNLALDAATGEYICFVDSDDTVSPDFVGILVQTLETNNADAAVCGFTFWNRTENTTCDLPTAPSIYSCEEFMLRFLEDWSCSLLWNKIFKREAVGDLRMAEGHRIDDEFFTYRVCMNCRRVALTDAALYHYRLRKSSAMQDQASVLQKVMLDRIQYNTERYQNVSTQMPDLDEPYFVYTLDTLARYWHHSKDMPIAQRQLRAWMGAHFGRLLRSKLTLKQKLSYILAFYLRKPAVTAEGNPIEAERDAYFD